MDEVSVIVGPQEAGKRLDVFLHEQTLAPSRAMAAALVDSGAVLVSGRRRSKGYKLQEGEAIELTEVAIAAEPLGPSPAGVSSAPRSGGGVPQASNDTSGLPEVPIVWEDLHLAVIDKPAGLVVHPAPGHRGGTLVDVLRASFSELSAEGGEERAGIVHRLDRDTSGLMLVAKTDAAHRSLSAMLKAREVARSYTALVVGEMPWDEGSVDAPIGRDPRDRKRMGVVPEGRRAKTFFEVKERPPGTTLLLVRLETGRTHQIRVHLDHIGYPVAGDALYGGKRAQLLAGELGGRHFLHSSSLALTHPITGEELAFVSDLPGVLQEVLDEARKDPGGR